MSVCNGQNASVCPSDEDSQTFYVNASNGDSFRLKGTVMNIQIMHYRLATVIGFVFVCMCLCLPCNAMQARPMLSCGVCVSVHLSRAWIVSKRVIVSLNFLHH